MLSVSLTPKVSLFQRIPFLLGLFVGLGGHAVKDAVKDDTPPPTEGDGGNPFRQAVTTAWREILMVAGTSTFWSCGFYVATTWVPTYVSSPDLVRADPSLPPVSEGSA